MSTSTQQIAPDVLLMSFPWRALGIDFKRTVTLLRLSDGRVVVHSTAKFTDEDIAAIRRFGEPAWLIDATLMHDTFAKEGRARLPGHSLSGSGRIYEEERRADRSIVAAAVGLDGGD